MIQKSHTSWTREWWSLVCLKARADIDAHSQGNPKPIAPPSVGPSTSTNTPSAPFPGSGNTLGSAPAAAQSSTSTSAPSQAPASAGSSGGTKHPEESINGLIQLGCQRAEAIKLLDATNGNVEMAASLLFSSQF